MKIINYLKKIFNNLLLSTKRFPLAALAAFITTFILMIVINNNTLFSDQKIKLLIELALTTSLAFPLFLSSSLIFERFPEIKKHLIYFLIFLFLLIYHLFIFKDFELVSISRFIALNISFYLLVLLIHYFYKRKNYELYIAHIFSKFFVTIVYTVVIFIGLITILFTLDKLFELSLAKELYISSWLLAAGIFAPIFMLAGIPLFKRDFDLNDYSSVLKILILYIIMPLLTIYSLILYLYFIKIIKTQLWPESIVGQLVFWYSMLSFLIIFFIKPFRKENKWVNKFILIMPKIILPLLIMMFFALSIRINDYGLTENRYYVFLLGIWIFLVMLYYNFSQKQRNTIVVFSLAIISILAVFGPWSGFSLAIKSQNQRFENILRENELLENNKIVKKPIPTTAKKEINSIIKYFTDKHSLEALNYLPTDFKKTEMEEVFGFKYQRYYSNHNNFYYRIPFKGKIFQLEDYNYLLDFQVEGSEILTSNQLENDLSLDFNSEQFKLELIKAEKVIFKQNLKNDLLQLQQKLQKSSEKDLKDLNQNYIYENEAVKMKIVFKYLSGELKSNSDLQLYRLNSFIFIQLK